MAQPRAGRAPVQLDGAGRDVEHGRHLIDGQAAALMGLSREIIRVPLRLLDDEEE